MSVFFAAASFYRCHFWQCCVGDDDKLKYQISTADQFYKDTYIQIFIVPKLGTQTYFAKIHIQIFIMPTSGHGLFRHLCRRYEGGTNRYTLWSSAKSGAHV